MSSELDPAERDFVYDRCDGRCAFCGHAVRRVTADSERKFPDVHDMFCIARFDKAKPEHVSNAVAACRTCCSLWSHCQTLPELRWLWMRKQITPTITDSHVRMIAANGGKAHFTYYYFWFERPEGRGALSHIRGLAA